MTKAVAVLLLLFVAACDGPTAAGHTGECCTSFTWLEYGGGKTVIQCQRWEPCP